MTNLKSSTHYEELLSETLIERNKLVYQVGEVKRQYGKELLDEQQWKKILDAAIQAGEEKGVEKTLIKDVWEAMHQVSLQIEGLVPVISEEEQLQDDGYEGKLDPIRKKLAPISNTILDCIVGMTDADNTTESVKTKAIEIITNVGLNHIFFNKLQVLISDGIDEEDFAGICGDFQKQFKLSDAELLENFAVSATAFKMWMGTTIPGEDKMYEVLKSMGDYIKNKRLS